MIIYFNDYKTYHLMKYEASIKNRRINDVQNDALISYIKKVSKNDEIILPKGKMKVWQLVKGLADSTGCTVAEFIEQSVIDYCGLSIQVVSKPQKKTSWLDLNRDAK